MTTPTKKGDPRAVADISEGLILATVDIAAPAERVRRLYRLSDPALSEVGLNELLDEPQLRAAMRAKRTRWRS